MSTGRAQLERVVNDQFRPRGGDLLGQLAEGAPRLVGPGAPGLVDTVALPVELVRPLATAGMRHVVRPGPGVLAADEEPLPSCVQRLAVRAALGHWAWGRTSPGPPRQGRHALGDRQQHLRSPVHRLDGRRRAHTVLPEAPPVAPPNGQLVGQRADLVEIVAQGGNDEARVGVHLVPAPGEIGVAISQVLVVSVSSHHQQVRREVVGPLVALDELVQARSAPPSVWGSAAINRSWE